MNSPQQIEVLTATAQQEDSMTDEKVREYCKRCKFREIRGCKTTKKVEYFCIQANAFHFQIPQCPLK